LEKKQFIVDEVMRLDRFLTEQLDESRNQIEQLIKKGFVQIFSTEKKEKKVKTGLKLQVGDLVKIELQDGNSFKSQEFSKEILQKTDWFNQIKIIYEDEYMMILDKPSGVVVHSAPSVKEPTLVDWLKVKGISLSTISGEERHGIVHRLDRGTSGLIVIAKSNKAHESLSLQLQDKSMGRYYLAFIDIPLKENITVEKSISRNRANRLKMGIVEGGKYAKTNFLKLVTSDNEKYELIAAKLFTGRTHQIRVHLESIHRHILGDSLYGFKGNLDKFSRVYLHAFGLYLNHPISGEKLHFYTDFPEDLKSFYLNNFTKEIYDKKIDLHFIIDSFNNSF
jgi:23S rRNA pseudouridine1911/1915/1917 synthase